MAKQKEYSVTTKKNIPIGSKPFIPSVIVLAVILLVYLGTVISFYPAMPVIATNAETIPGYDRTYPPFRVDEFNYNDIARNILSGDVYGPDSSERRFPIGFPAVATPFVALFGDIGGYIANAFIVWLSVLLFYLLLRRHAGQTKSLILTAIFAFATLNWFYAASCYSEPLAQLLVLLSFLLLTVDRGHRRWNLLQVLSGAVCGLLLFVRPHYILIAIPFFLYRGITGIKPRKFDTSALLFAAGTASIILLWFIRNAAVFGSPLSFEYSRLAGSFAPGMESGRYMKGNIFAGSHRLLFDMYHGLFTITPVFLLFPAGLHRMWQAGLKRESMLLLGSAVLMALFIAAGPYPFTEFGLGSRHLVPLLPLLWFPAVFFLDKTVFTKAIVTVLAVYTFYHAGIGWFTGGEPGMGFYIGILNSSQSRAALLARKGMLPKKTFSSRQELLKAYRDALEDAHLLRFLQTLHPSVVEKIRGHEREFMLNIRNQPDPTVLIDSLDPETGILITRFSFSE